MDESLFWTKVAAIGQVAGAAATFLAAWVALYLGRTDRQFRLRVTATFQNIVSSHGSIKVMCIQVENIGMRTARIEGFGWTPGHAIVWRFLPKPSASAACTTFRLMSGDRKTLASGKGVSVRVYIGGRRIHKKKKTGT